MNKEQLQELTDQIAKLSKRGHYFDGENSTSLYDWLAEGDPEYVAGATHKELANEWDEEG